jgi:tRNA (guanine37-N1)-methyltransferase
MRWRKTKHFYNMHFHIITLFPNAFRSYLGESIIKRAIEKKKIKVSFYNPRDFAKDKSARVDKRPYGGGPGMVLEAEPILKAVKKAVGKKNPKEIKIIFFTPSGKQFDTKYAEQVRKASKHIVLICGRYEGVDARVQKILKAKQISIGPYTLTGGELPAMVILDSITRRVRGVLGKDASVEERRVAGNAVYTRPEILTWKGKKYRVPKILLSGHHEKIERWKLDKKRAR